MSVPVGLWRLSLPPKLSGAPAPNRATRATIALPESDRPDGREPAMPLPRERSSRPGPAFMFERASPGRHPRSRSAQRAQPRGPAPASRWLRARGGLGIRAEEVPPRSWSDARGVGNAGLRQPSGYCSLRARVAVSDAFSWAELRGCCSARGRLRWGCCGGGRRELRAPSDGRPCDRPGACAFRRCVGSAARACFQRVARAPLGGSRRRGGRDRGLTDRRWQRTACCRGPCRR